MPRLLSLTLVALLTLLTPAARTTTAQEREPSRETVLRIETGMHTAVITRIGVDAGNRYLVTGSHDKTVRVWELASGRLLRVLRVPIGAGNEGKVNAVAISSDGNLIAAGGWTVEASTDRTASIYLFGRESGQIVRRIGGLPEVALQLAFAPDGTRHAAALGRGGVRVFRVADGAEAGRDADYGAPSYGLDFDRAGRLVTSCLDGYVRLYDRDMRLLAKVKATGGKRPLAVRFAPDGTKIAVGYHDSTRVDVLAAGGNSQPLSLLYSPDTSDVNDGNLGNVAWSANGAALYAGGTGKDASGNCLIRRWEADGRGAYRVWAAARSTIFDLAPLSDGGVAYGAGGPSWGIFTADGRRARLVSGEIADYRALLQGFLTDAAGGAVRFGYEQFGKSPATFNLSERRLTLGDAADNRLRPPRTDGLAVTNWHNAYEPKINGAKLPLEQYEFSRSLAVAPDAGSFLLGTVFYIRLFDRDGKERWNAPTASEVWSVNISGDGRLALAAFGDGTIRWYRVTDGKELLAFFPHADRKRWVVWSPSGYYDASPGAEDLIGWHVNNGRDAAADFFPAGQFRDVYYRPDVVSKVLETGDEARAVQLANEEAGRKQQQVDVAQLLPPVVEIVSPADGAETASSEIVVRFAVRTPSGEPVTEVKALVDGRPAATERGLSLPAAGTQIGTTRELRVIVPEGESQIAVVASNRFTTSVPATVRVRRARPTPALNTAATASAVRPAATAPATDAAFEIRPKLYVLAVGVSSYADPKLKLNFAAKDARDFASAWERQQGTLYREVVVKLLADDKATKDEVLDGLDWIRKETTSKDVAVILLAGHGVNDPTGSYYFLPHNADVERLLRTGVSFNDIKQTVATIAGKVLFFIDTCHSGNVLGSQRRAILDDLNGVVNELASAENGAVVFAASTGKQYSLEKMEWNNGAFTLAVVESLGGRADYDKSGKGKITINMLDLYISERVKELTRGQQTPTTAKPNTIPDFPVALKR